MFASFASLAVKAFGQKKRLPKKYVVALSLLKRQQMIADQLLSLSAPGNSMETKISLQNEFAELCEEIERQSLLKECGKIHALIASSDDADCSMQLMTEGRLSELIGHIEG